jgi:hypothetical protein
MSIKDKNIAMWEWIKTYPNFENETNGNLYFNFGEASDNNSFFIPVPTDYVVKQDIMGTKTRFYTFAITTFKDIANNPYSMENINDYSEVQNFLDWIEEQNNQRSFPDFGENCNVLEVLNLSNMANVSNQDQQLAKYMTQCRVVYEEK